MFNIFVAVCTRDRAEIAKPCITRMVNVLQQVHVWVDPLSTEYGVEDVNAWGAIGKTIDISETMPVKSRIATMRIAAAKFALLNNFEYILFLDSDILISYKFLEELQRLIPIMKEMNCKALTLANYKQYELRCTIVKHDELGVSIRRFGLGGCLLFPVSQSLADTKVSKGSSWDTYLCQTVASRRILTSHISYVRHLGQGTGLSADRGLMNFDFSNLAEDLA